MICWHYKGKCLEEIPEGIIGFTYKITCLSGEYTGYIYVGMKMFTTTRTKKLSKKAAELAYSGRGKRPTKTKVSTESNWKQYTSSSKFLKELIEQLGLENFNFEILSFSKTKSDLCLSEVEWMVHYNVMRIPNSFNEWISIKVRKNNIQK